MAPQPSNMVVGVDAMGGDIGPAAVVPGAVEALRQQRDFQLALYGDEVAIGQQLDQLDTRGLSLHTVPCSQNIGMSEAPAAAIRNKPDSPVVRGMRDQKAGRVHAFVSAGSTGAVVAASLLILGRLSSVDRPAIATLIPTRDAQFLLLDAGANVYCTPEHLLSFARMGVLFSQRMMDLQEPRVGLLNIGTEPSKGSELTIAAHKLLQEAPLHFVGNIESNQLLLRSADVVVTDGFTGNMVLKLIEGFTRYLEILLEGDNGANGQTAGHAALWALLAKRFNYEAYGGALLLGIAGVTIIGHGRSTSRAISNAVLAARQQILLDFPLKLQAHLAG
jgi:glycerol-3-phosphate acyltransferase PlsX